MTLSKSALKEWLLESWKNVGTTPAECAAKFAKAVGDYAADVVPTSSMVETATSLLETQLTLAFGSKVPGLGLPLSEQAFALFASMLGLGMAPAYTATPPAEPVGFADQTKGIGDLGEAADMLAGLIHDWMTSGTAVQNIPAPPPAIPWS